MHGKNQPARQLSHSTFYLQRGFQGSACTRAPALPAGLREMPGRAPAGRFAPSPAGKPRGSGTAPPAREALAAEEAAPAGGSAGCRLSGPSERLVGPSGQRRPGRLRPRVDAAAGREGVGVAEGQPRFLRRGEPVHDAGEAVQAGQGAALVGGEACAEGRDGDTAAPLPRAARAPRPREWRAPPQPPRPRRAEPALPGAISAQQTASKLLPLADHTGLPQSACKTARGECRPCRPRQGPRDAPQEGKGPQRPAGRAGQAAGLGSAFPFSPSPRPHPSEAALRGDTETRGLGACSALGQRYLPPGMAGKPTGVLSGERGKGPVLSKAPAFSWCADAIGPSHTHGTAPTAAGRGEPAPGRPGVPTDLSLLPLSYHPIGAAGSGAGRFGATLSRQVIVVFYLLPQELLEALDVSDGVSQDLYFGESLVGVGSGASLQGLKSLVHFLQPPPLPHGGCLPPVHCGGFSFAGFASPHEAVTGLVVARGSSDMLLFLGAGGLGGLVGAEGRQIPGLKILGELALRRGEAGAVIEELGRGELAAVHHLHPCCGGVSAGRRPPALGEALRSALGQFPP